jgi:hypothetical protein
MTSDTTADAVGPAPAPRPISVISPAARLRIATALNSSRTHASGSRGNPGAEAYVVRAGAIGVPNPQNNPTRSSSSATWNGFSRITAGFSSSSLSSIL